ncbi:phosphate/phosphite/phosphonate ABC transporter substrate-binding protein [Ornithinibacillus sp. BX22]|uniref:Phosphate/phosphite/phosphonate ABC transporter substrate-binding protein n=1 Tax=Ornithinibacillus hominis TaxID=2763055 RepID=A0A923L8E5_9BACI|nr:phosphate/phosphite/phosphonate ABC transporter substrate-binding protein [Ornithinibacillus hominis]MBC5638457.1 phosphate/phosphite/phosphonate ABC transporter substrate-binding protein [Ornithinibacillus hominis]
MKFKQWIIGLISIMLAVTLVACGTDSNGNNDEVKEKLVVQFVPTNNDGSMEAKAKPFAEYLSKQLDREVEVTLATDYSTIVEAMSSNQVDIGIMPPAAYVQAKDMGKAEAILTSQLGAYDKETGLPLEGELTNTFKGEVLVRSDSDIHSLLDLKGKRIATLSPNSASGYIYPVAEMKDAGIDPTTEATLTTVNDIPSEITAVLNGQMDAAFVFEGARNVFASSFGNNDLFEELRVLYLTEGDIPNDAIAVSTDMDEALKEQVKQVFLDMKNDEEGAEAMSLWNHQGYQEAADSAYDTVRHYTDQVLE